ncbi:DUF2892 domain-containing protein [Rugamonas sp.]|uniref:YgaP family membrane protein n=1 Tax=Rugamonas sp. TaxID=1926287 RepID=UPI0025E8D383|nr:DUF2892 domain-containing protein [Rugamonas sp.]
MQKNIGLFDRRGRVILGVVLALFFIREDAWRWVGLLSPVMFATAYISWCPIYRALGMRTTPKPKSRAK